MASPSPAAVWLRRPTLTLDGLLALDGVPYLASAAGTVILVRSLNGATAFIVDLPDAWCSCSVGPTACGHAAALRDATDAAG